MNEVKEFCEAHNACEEGAEWASAYTSLADVYDNCPRADWLMWMLAQVLVLDGAAAVGLACEFAERVLPFYEAVYPEQAAPRLAIEAARAWLANPGCTAQYAAAYDASVAAFQAAADTAAYQADAAALAAAYAARAATCVTVSGAYYAASDAADAAIDVAAELDAERRAQADIVRRLIPNPWRRKNEQG